MSLIIGLTGSIASGKSTVSAMFTELGITVIDADIEARLAVEPGEKAYNDIVSHFGTEVLEEDGTINRPALGSIIFNNEEKRLLLNSIVHPAVRERMAMKRQQAEAANEKAVVLDIPLLFESKLTGLVEKIIVVYVDEKTQLERLMSRNGFSEDEALSRIKSQMPLKDKVDLADEVIDNTGTIEQSRQQLKKILNKWGI
ncbi:dephospho-CoA kinase [Mesobacillus sp. AQ2]|jgi:dephospho-CoA kinase|uniref:dephospho-CoA kinase n=1 Tax=Bacillaceae TaxID=186817 RepID=UPI0011A5D8F5|nr:MULTISPECIES: dephospho-CoA kinase [Bacillaceae]MCM3122680.1 dephospho-CoA kinase [Mesobacillus sp. MER 33]MCM3232644.1 dephospho-CoA kinase [Mesobacillus sp. MER 48]WHX39570.1 dephospho-CoA kinase [Mesobacillus sp. AQ2]